MCADLQQRPRQAGTLPFNAPKPDQALPWVLPFPEKVRRLTRPFRHLHTANPSGGP